MMKILSLSVILLFSMVIHADETGKSSAIAKFENIDWSDTYPKKDLSKEKNPVASEFAEVGGTIVVNGGQYPKSFNYFTDNSTFTVTLFDLMYDTLLNFHPISLEKIPSLVEKWEISSDKKFYRMHLNPNAKWSDGKPITSQDVLFTYKILMDPNSLTAPFKVEYSKIKEPVVIDDRTFVFETNDIHWNIYNIIAGFQVLPKHEMEGKDFNKIAFEFPVVSGSYKIKSVKEGQYLEFERRKDWWQRNFVSNQNTRNFDFIRFKFFQDSGNSYESFIKGEIDFFAVSMAARWIKEAVGDKFDNNWIVKQRIFNYTPAGFQGLAINMRKDLFKDRRVREALACLFNRERMNKESMYSQYKMTTSYVADLYDNDHPNLNTEIKFNPEKAKKLFDEAGWKPNKEGVLEKDGVKFEFKILTRSPSYDKFLDIYIDDLAKVGVKFTIDLKDSSAWSKDMDVFNFDMTFAGWASSLYKDPESMWDSKQKDINSSSNITGFSSKEVDALIEVQKTEFDLEKRNEINRKIDKILTDEIPYILLWHNDHHRLLYWNKFGTPSTVLDKYSRPDVAINLWWYDEDAAQSLENAKKKNKALPKKPLEVIFDQAFEGAAIEKPAQKAKEGEIDWSDSYPKIDLTKEKNPLASEFAEVGGTIVINGNQYPKSFNYFVDNNVFASTLFDLMYDSLLVSHPITLEKMPSIVEKWEISSDKKYYRMHINPNAKWSDGKPITSQDVLFTYKVIMDPKNLTAPLKVNIQKIKEPVVVDDSTFIFETKEIHWNIYNILAGFQVLPKHEMEGKDFNKIAFEFPVVSGSYKIKTVKEGQFLDMERRKDWWQRSFVSNQNVGNFETIRYKFFQDGGNGYEAFVKGEVDYYAVYMSSRWIKEAVGDKFDNNWIVKQRVFNYSPAGFQGFAMNMRRDLFKDQRVREALACLLDRERMNKDIMYSQYQMTSSYYSDLYDKENPCTNIENKFNPEKAKKLLSEAGWVPNKEGVLEKDGVKFEFKFLTRDESSDKFLDIYMDDLAKVGVKFTIERKDWSSWSKDMDVFNYDMTWAAWGGGIYKDPEGMWDSKYINMDSSSNICGFGSREVDRLIEVQKTEFDLSKRNMIVREIDKVLAIETPYILLWHNNYHRLLYWNKFGTPATVLGRTSNEDAAVAYWWYDEDAVASLENAKKKNKALPKKPTEVNFDEAFNRK